MHHEGHEAHEGYDLGGFETRLKIIFLSFNFVRFAIFVVRSNSFYKIGSVTVVIQKICPQAAEILKHSSTKFRD